MIEVENMNDSTQQNPSMSNSLTPKSNILKIRPIVWFLFGVLVTALTGLGLFFIFKQPKESGTVLPSVEPVTDVNEASTFPVSSQDTVNTANISYGLWYPYSNNATINNPQPTIYGKIKQTNILYLPTTFGLEKSPVSSKEEYFLRFIPGKVTNLTVTLNGKPISTVYGFTQYPAVLCKTYNYNPDGSKYTVDGKDFPADDIYSTEKECLENKSAEIPPLIFVFKPGTQLASGTHILTVRSGVSELGSITFTVDPKFTFTEQKLTIDKKTDFSGFDAVDNCTAGYYHAVEYLPIPLPISKQPNIWYGLSFPQSESEKGSIKRRKVQISFENAAFDLFFPSSTIFYEDKKLVSSSYKYNVGEIPPDQRLYISDKLFFFTDGKKANYWKPKDGYNSPASYFELYPIDISGREYRGQSLPWMTSNSSGCDG